MEGMLASRCTAEHIKSFQKRRVYGECVWANEERNWQTAESYEGIQCMSVRALDISPSSSFLRSLFLSSPLLFLLPSSRDIYNVEMLDYIFGKIWLPWHACNKPPPEVVVFVPDKLVGSEMKYKILMEPYKSFLCSGTSI